jgi:hypothetical protein
MEFETAITPQEEEYADSEYRRFLKETDQYMDFDEFCRQELII